MTAYCLGLASGCAAALIPTWLVVRHKLKKLHEELRTTREEHGLAVLSHQRSKAALGKVYDALSRHIENGGPSMHGKVPMNTITDIRDSIHNVLLNLHP